MQKPCRDIHYHLDSWDGTMMWDVASIQKFVGGVDDDDCGIVFIKGLGRGRHGGGRTTRCSPSCCRDFAKFFTPADHCPSCFRYILAASSDHLEPPSSRVELPRREGSGKWRKWGGGGGRGGLYGGRGGEGGSQGAYHMHMQMHLHKHMHMQAYVLV